MIYEESGEEVPAIGAIGLDFGPPLDAPVMEDMQIWAGQHCHLIFKIEIEKAYWAFRTFGYDLWSSFGLFW